MRYRLQARLLTWKWVPLQEWLGDIHCRQPPKSPHLVLETQSRDQHS